MSIWDPHTYKPGGVPIGATAPPALRVHGSPASANQLGMAQAAFYRFCMMARLSVVPNPVEAGRLPDGTAYRIVRIGNSTTMEIWPEDAANERESGIGITMVDLLGDLVPELTHSNGTSPQPFILTPEVVPGTRICTGRWRVRKVNGYNGGKAVFQTRLPDLYLTGVDGVSTFFQLPPPPSFDALGGTNMRAYRYGTYGPGFSVYSVRRPVAEFRSDAEPLPFFRKHSNGSLWIMQAVAKFAGGPQRIELWGQQYRPPGGTVGELVATLPIPAGHTVKWDSLSSSADGQRLRAVFTTVLGNFLLVDLAVGDASLSIVTTSERGSRIEGWEVSTNTGTELEPNITGTRMGPISFGNATYGYDGKGRDFEVLLGGGGRLEHWTYRESFSGEVIGVDPIRGPITLENEGLFLTGDYSDPGGLIRINGHDITFPSVAGQSSSELLVTRTVADGVTLTYAASGFIRDWAESWQMLQVLFFDPTTELVIQAQKIQRGDYSAVYESAQTSDGNWYPLAVPSRLEGTVYTNRGEVLVQCRGQIVASIDISDADPHYFAVSAAVDPWTGAVCANLMQYTAEDRQTVLRSWIFVADDTGARELHTIMKMPMDHTARVRTDESLISV